MRNGFILVANSSSDLFSTLKAALATTPYAFLHAKDGEEAVDYLDLLRSEIRVVIIDLELLLINGLDVIWLLVRERRPRIIATSYLAVPLMEQPLQEFGAALVRLPAPAATWRNIVSLVLNGRRDGAGLNAGGGLQVKPEHARDAASRRRCKISPPLRLCDS